MSHSGARPITTGPATGKDLAEDRAGHAAQHELGNRQAHARGAAVFAGIAAFGRQPRLLDHGELRLHRTDADAVAERRPMMSGTGLPLTVTGPAPAGTCRLAPVPLMWMTQWTGRMPDG
jgi:hypothetical protein